MSHKRDGPEERSALESILYFAGCIFEGVLLIGKSLMWAAIIVGFAYLVSEYPDETQEMLSNAKHFAVSLYQWATTLVGGVVGSPEVINSS